MEELLDFVSRHVFASIFGAAGMALTMIGFAEQAEKIVTGWKAWQLQALGAALFFLSVIMVLVSYDSDRVSAATDSRASHSSATASVGDEPMGLLEREYISLMSGKHTNLQEQKFLQTYVGKEMDLTLELVSINGYLLRAQFTAGENADVFVAFEREWADYLASKSVGEKIKFRTTIIKEGDNYYSLGKARPL